MRVTLTSFIHCSTVFQNGATFSDTNKKPDDKIRKLTELLTYLLTAQV